MAPKTQYIQLLKSAPYLFCPQFTTARWLFVPLCDRDHWILAAADLHNIEINTYSSCDEEFNDYYVEPHLETIRWMICFLAWRLG
jgi:pyrroloquinoline quinone (PQQ) biosynthesis protein C